MKVTITLYVKTEEDIKQVAEALREMLDDPGIKQQELDLSETTGNTEPAPQPSAERVKPKRRSRPKRSPQPTPTRKRRVSTKRRTPETPPKERASVKEKIQPEVIAAPIEDSEMPVNKPAAVEEKVVKLRDEPVASADAVNPNAVFSALVQRSKKAAISLLERYQLSRFSEAKDDTLVAMVKDAQALLDTLKQTA
jgi:hypothetical protein